MKWMIGIDGGGTKTTAIAGDLAGGILGRVEKGPANYQVTGLANFQALVAEIVADLSLNCRLKRDELEVISLGLAGVDRVRDRELIEAALADLKLGCSYIVNNDAVVALTAGLGKREGIVLVAGTGSIAFGINAAGGAVRAGGWGHVIGDEGSGYDIGRQALARGLRAREGRDKPTVLLAKIMAAIKVDDPDGVIEFVYNPAASKAAIAALTEVVAAAARLGDAVAQEILDAAADDLAGLVESVIDRGFSAAGQVVPVCTYGGVINNIPAIRQRIGTRLAGKARLVAADREPALGALQLGYEYLKKGKT
jgi:N-acetylglucosamine kinase-like BadF-type ATPase